MVQTTFQLSENLKLIVEEGQFGKFIRVRSRDSWICLSPGSYKILVANISKLKKVQYNFTLKLSPQKRIAVLPLTDRIDAVIHSTNISNGEMYHTFIVLNESEWLAFLNHLKESKVCEMDGFAAMDTSEIEKDIRIRDIKNNCNTCKNQLKAVMTYNGKMQQCKLTKEQIKEINDGNAKVQNQLGMTCTFCGITGYYNCHCHGFDCKRCEPDNFCEDCGEIIVYKSKVSV